MEVRILGPLTVFRDGVVATPSAPKLRRVLSLLVTCANNVVQTEQIIEELWEDHPPLSVTTTLQTYIYQLRKLLRLNVPHRTTDGRRDDSIVPALYTFASGYQLALAPDALDAQQFERLAEAGRIELETGDMAKASGILSEALRLWRAPALVDVPPGPVLRAEVVRLEEIRKSTLERRIDVDLCLGRHHELLSELTGVVAQQPTHEGFQAKLMLALHRAGRRSEALRAYQHARTVLADELGLDPSGGLQRLHQAILDADDSLNAPNPPETQQVSFSTTQLSQLPPEGPAIIGRDEEMAAVTTALTGQERSAPAIVLTAGTPGVGRTAFCVHAGHQVRAAYPDGQLFAELLTNNGDPVDPSDVLAGFLHAAGTPEARIPATLEERRRMFRTWTAERRVLVIINDAVSAEQFMPLLPSGKDCGVLIASRRRLFVPGITTLLELRPLSTDDGIELLSNALGRHRVLQEVQSARHLVQLCDGLPLAIQAAVTRLQIRPHWTLRRVVDALSSGEGNRYAVLAEQFGLRASVERTYRLARPAVQAAFRGVGAMAGAPITLTAAVMELGLDEYGTETLLEELVEFGLLTAEPADNDSGRFQYRVLPVVGAVAEELRSLAVEGVVVPVQADARATRHGSLMFALKPVASHA